MTLNLDLIVRKNQTNSDLRDILERNCSVFLKSFQVIKIWGMVKIKEVIQGN